MENKLQALIYDKDFDLKKCQFDLTPHFNGKPKKALWTSSYIDEESISSWYIWCCMEDFELKNCLYLIEPKSEIKVLELNNAEDLLDLPTVRVFNQVTLDFERIIKEGLWSIKDLSIYYLNLVFSSFWGRDCESTAWFNVDWINRIWLERSSLNNNLQRVTIRYIPDIVILG